MATTIVQPTSRQAASNPKANAGSPPKAASPKGSSPKTTTPKGSPPKTTSPKGGKKKQATTGEATEVQLNTSAAQALHTVMNDALAGLTTQSSPSSTVAHEPSNIGKLLPIGAGHMTDWKLPKDMNDTDKRIVDALRHVVTCRTMQWHHQTFANLADDITWDAPPVLLTGRDAMRDMVYAAKSIASMDFDVNLFQREVLDQYNHRLHLDVLFHVMPSRPFFPLTVMVPEDFPIRATIVLGVRRSPTEAHDSWGVINWIHGRWHNLPVLPNILRQLSGWSMGHLLRLTEPIWVKALPLIGDTSLEARQHVGQAATSSY